MSKIGNRRYLTHVDIRGWLRDNDPAANLLIDDFEYSPEELEAAATYAVDYWNELPPAIGAYDFDKFPWRFALLKGASAQLLLMAANRFRRNDLQYSAGGTNVADQAKHESYERFGLRLWDDYKQWVAMMKRAMNMERGWGTI